MNGLPARWGPDEWAMVLYLFSKSRVTFSWNLGVGRKGQRTKEAGRREDRKGVPALISLQRSGKPGWDGGGGGEKGNIGTRSRQERGVY